MRVFLFITIYGAGCATFQVLCCPIYTGFHIFEIHLKSRYMKRTCIIFMLLIPALTGYPQKIQDLFQPSDVKVSWLGIDYSHVKLIGNFSEFMDAGMKDPIQIRNIYFPRWNRIILDEREKYDVGGMLRKPDIYYDIDPIADVNSKADVDAMQSYNMQKFTDADLQNYVNQYDLTGKEGLGVLFMAECLNKGAVEAYYHFIVINMSTREILFHRRLRGEPQGFGIRNYWANSVCQVIQNIKYFYYSEWEYQETQHGSNSNQVTL
jgi:hypothetical protein